jgi:hypothetical protein
LLALSTQRTLLELQRQVVFVPVKVDEQDVGTVGHEVEVNVCDPQQYWLLLLRQTVI